MAKKKNGTITNRKKVRSPNHPCINLATAIENARSLYEQDRRHQMPPSVVHERWGYRPYSSMANQCEAALKAYKLLDVESSGELRKLCVSEIGERIIGNAPDREAVLRTAALGPKIHMELWNRFGQGELPSDETIQAYLTWERENGRFTAEAAVDVISRFKESIAFAHMHPNDTMSGGAPGQIRNNTPEGNGQHPSRQNPAGSSNVIDKPTSTDLPITVLMDDGTVQIVSIPKMTPKAFEFFQGQLELFRSAIVVDERIKSVDS